METTLSSNFGVWNGNIILNSFILLFFFLGSLSHISQWLHLLLLFNLTFISSCFFFMLTTTNYLDLVFMLNNSVMIFFIMISRTPQTLVTSSLLPWFLWLYFHTCTLPNNASSLGSPSLISYVQTLCLYTLIQNAIA